MPDPTTKLITPHVGVRSWPGDDSPLEGQIGYQGGSLSYGCWYSVQKWDCPREKAVLVNFCRCNALLVLERMCCSSPGISLD